MNHNQKIGSFGESLAKKYLEERGYEIVDMNAKAGFKEIDIIAILDNDLIFVEVKTRTSSAFGEASDAILGKKLKNFQKAISLYLGKTKINYREIRADFIAIDIDKASKSAKVQHFKDII